MSLTVVIATRGRPAILADTLSRFLANTERDDTKYLVCIDDDDAETVDAIGTLPKGPIYSVKPREATRGMKYDRALTEAPADLYLVGVDHTPILTKGFDRLFLEAAALFPDGIGCVYTPMANASFPYLQAVTARFADLMGYIQPHHFPFWFIDHWLDDVARMTGRYVMADVECDSSKRPGKTTGLMHLVFWAGYFDALVVERRAQANRIIDAMDEPEATKQRLRQSFPLVEYRSLWVNDQVRAMHKAIEADRGGGQAVDERYVAVLKKATAHWQELIDADGAA